MKLVLINTAKMKNVFSVKLRQWDTCNLTDLVLWILIGLPMKL